MSVSLLVICYVAKLFVCHLLAENIYHACICLSARCRLFNDFWYSVLLVLPADRDTRRQQYGRSTGKYLKFYYISLYFISYVFTIFFSLNILMCLFFKYSLEYYSYRFLKNALSNIFFSFRWMYFFFNYYFIESFHYSAFLHFSFQNFFN